MQLTFNLSQNRFITVPSNEPMKLNETNIKSAAVGTEIFATANHLNGAREKFPEILKTEKFLKDLQDYIWSSEIKNQLAQAKYKQIVDTLNEAVDELMQIKDEKLEEVRKHYENHLEKLFEDLNSILNEKSNTSTFLI